MVDDFAGLLCTILDTFSGGIIITHEVVIPCLVIQYMKCHFVCFERCSSIHLAVRDGCQDDRDCNGQFPFASLEEIKQNRNTGRFALTCVVFFAPEMTVSVLGKSWDCPQWFPAHTRAIS